MRDLSREGLPRSAAARGERFEARTAAGRRGREKAQEHLPAARHRQLLGLLQPAPRPRGEQPE